MAPLALFFAAPLATPVRAQETYTIVTGDPGGVYYPVAGAICSLVNRISRSGPVCRTRASAGSVFNIGALRSGDAQFAIVQNDIERQAAAGTGLFAEAGVFADLRTVFSLHTESVTILARRDSGVEMFDDLRGRRVNIGNAGSGQRATMDEILAAKGWTLADFAVVSELSATKQTSELCEGDLEAGIYIVGHPAGVIKAAMQTCDLVLVTARDVEIDAFVASRGEYRLTTIQAELYPGVEADIETFGVTASLVTTAGVSNQIVDDLVSSAMRDFDMLQSAHPTLAALDPAEMAGAGVATPLHEAAARYFRVTGFITDDARDP